MEFHSYSPICPFKSIEDIQGKHVTVMGLGLNGGGEADYTPAWIKSLQSVAKDIK